MDQAPVRLERRAAAAFLAAAAPLVLAVAAAGGLLALAPLLAIVVPILLAGTVPGLGTLHEARRRLIERDPREEPGVVSSGRRDERAPLSPLARLRAGRGPPLIA
ncbi:MAG: hypothetical protein KJ006_07455 [Thermoleophilia bacterium]|nr:hypothetical protein [Thermoleophilia bacterium]